MGYTSRAATPSERHAWDVGYAIHMAVIAEAESQGMIGYLVHGADGRSFFEKYDRVAKKFSHKFSDELTARIMVYRRELKIYARMRGRAPPPGDRF